MAAAILAFLGVPQNYANVVALWDMGIALAIVSTAFGAGYAFGFGFGAAKTARRIRQHLIARRIG